MFASHGEDRRSEESPVPWRTIWATIGSIVAVVLVAIVAMQISRVLVWIGVAVFLAVALDPLVGLLARRLHLRRSLAATATLLLALLVVGSVGFVVLRPLVAEGSQAVDDLPRYVDDVRNGRGPIGEIVARYDLERWVSEHQDEIRGSVSQLGSRSVQVAGAIGNAVVGTLTVLVLTFLMLLEGPGLLAAGLSFLPTRHRERTAALASECRRAVTGYMAGNLLVSIVAGAATYVFLWAAGVPFRGVLAIFVAIADLIPLVGATLGAVVVTLVAFVHGPAVGIAAIIFFVLYQQIENHALQPVIQARTVKLSPLVVLVSVLIGVELAGILGAFVAIPIAGIAKVLGRDVVHRRFRGGTDAIASRQQDPSVDPPGRPELDAS